MFVSSIRLVSSHFGHPIAVETPSTIVVITAATCRICSLCIGSDFVAGNIGGMRRRFTDPFPRTYILYESERNRCGLQFETHKGPIPLINKDVGSQKITMCALAILTSSFILSSSYYLRYSRLLKKEIMSINHPNRSSNRSLKCLLCNRL